MINTNGTRYATAQAIIPIPDIVIGKLLLSRLFDEMTIARQAVARRGRRLECFTIAWNTARSGTP